MCGIGGFSFVGNFDTRLKLVIGLGQAIDSRGHAMAGFASFRNLDNNVIVNRKQGSWTQAQKDFFERAASGEICMMHSRAPGFGAPVTDAHPFPIIRDGVVKLWGAHNGSLDQAWESARSNNRHITVDSMELFELLADNKINELNNMTGWGVAEWIEAEHPSRINLSRLTDGGDLEAVSLKTGGVVYASTMRIIKFAVEFANLEIDRVIDVSETGRTYFVENGSITRSDQSGVRLSRGNWW